MRRGPRMKTVVVTDQNQKWFEISDATVLTARRYLEEPESDNEGTVRVLNLCRTGRYQGRGYYVSLVAEARGHRPWPDVKTIEDLQSDDPRRLLSGDDDAAWTVLDAPEGKITIESYFGRDPAGHNDAAARQLFALLHAPFIRATFQFIDVRWTPTEARLLYPGHLDSAQLKFAAAAAADYLASSVRRQRGKGPPALAILHNPDAPDPPSTPAALKMFC